MSTLSFQDYVRKRMLKRRAEAMRRPGRRRRRRAGDAGRRPRRRRPPRARCAARAGVAADDPRSTTRTAFPIQAPADRRQRRAASLQPRRRPRPRPASPSRQASPRQAGDLLNELRSIKGLIEERFGMLAFLERLQRRPAEARLTQKLLDCGFSPVAGAQARRRPAAPTSSTRTTGPRRCSSATCRPPRAARRIEDRGGVFALIGATGVGKTTTTAKIAAAFAAKHGAGNLGLITLDAYRVGAHEQLRAYGRILGVPVHTAHDRASLEDLLDLLSAKKMVLIDTAGMAQRDSRTRELLDMLSHRSVQRLLVVNAAAQGETIEDVLLAYRAATCTGDDPEQARRGREARARRSTRRSATS